MSLCCSAIIITVIIIGIIILYVLYKFYNKLNEKLNKDDVPINTVKTVDDNSKIQSIFSSLPRTQNKTTTEATTTTATATNIPQKDSVSKVSFHNNLNSPITKSSNTTINYDNNDEDENLTDHDNYDKEEEEKEQEQIQNSTITTIKNLMVFFSVYNNKPSLRLCPDRQQCEYMEFCNIHLCKHLTQIAKLNTDKNTKQNVTYIHLPKCVIVFITKNETTCKKDQEITFDEDVNYISSYTSKYIDMSIFIVFYDKATMKFIDLPGKLYDEYSIQTENEPLVREVLLQAQIVHQRLYTYPRMLRTIATAPTMSINEQQQQQQPQQQQSKADNQGNFFYIAKQ